jgi:hypothetical protein
MTTKTEHEWLRRLSDYHSGEVDAAEAAAVEEHLAGCPECREALRVYRRFYVLASSPLRLGEPSNAVAEQLSASEDASGSFRVGDGLGRYPHARDRMRQARSRRLLGIASVLAASLVIAGFLAVLGPRIGNSGRHPTPTPYPSATPSGPTPTVQTTNLPAAGTGYTNAGPDWATELASAPSSPNTLYACGLTVSSSGSGEYLVAVSTDGGHTWRSQASPGILPGKLPVTVPLQHDWSLEKSYHCNLAVAPATPRDLALLSQYCTDVISEAPYQCNAESSQLYRSVDGGESWSLVNTPGGDWIVSGAAMVSEIAWVGSDLFVDTTEGIARSIAGGPFTLLQQPYFGTGSQAAEARQLFVLGNTLIVQHEQCPGVGVATCASQTARSDDQGAHWSLMSLSYRSTQVSLTLVGADGKTLIGSDYSLATEVGTSQYLQSEDLGATWRLLPPLPELPSGSTSGGPLAAAPDGTIFAWLLFTPPSPPAPTYYGIYEFAPGALNWRYFAASPAGVPLIFLWNNAGHLAVIWAERGSPNVSGFQYRLF